ncbi:hypothetical protein LTLLF_167885 [Microtus ochrogaster]|uniref:Uncharacterized protein n=1 Tax=Microtus ochrogaster TaxID=79684 RepID=A0A8J6GBM8_MICOH|nr:hypothetical protein LTLLF_167885 [Microtus ochrogaster]
MERQNFDYLLSVGAEDDDDNWDGQCVLGTRLRHRGSCRLEREEMRKPVDRARLGAELQPLQQKQMEQEKEQKEKEETPQLLVPEASWLTGTMMAPVAMARRMSRSLRS